MEEASNKWWLEDEVTLAEILAGAGYQTALSGKWHIGNDMTPQCGFESWFTLGGSYPINRLGPYTYSNQGQPVESDAYKTQIITDKAIAFLRDRDPERPFFLMVGYRATHSPWENHPERAVAPYRDCTFEDIPYEETYPFGVQNLESTLPTWDDPREALAQYYASVIRLDEATARLLDELDALGLRENTLVVYTSDHGLCCGHHGIWGKGNGTLPLNMVEESIRVPMIFNHPRRVSGGQRLNEFVDHLDLFQTLAAYAGADLPEDRKASYPGRNMWPLLDGTGAEPDWRVVQYGEYGNVRMIRTHTHKLVRRYPDGPHELFDFEKDPREMSNLFNDPVEQPRIIRLTALLEDHFATYQDPVKTGLRVRELPQHNLTEAWRTEI